MLKVSSKFGLTMPAITFAKDIIMGCSAEVVLGNLFQNVLKSVSGAMLAPFYAELGMMAGTAIFPGAGTFIGGVLIVLCSLR